jgi:putative MFS transporter
MLITLGFVNGFTPTAVVGVTMQLFNAMYIFSTQVYTTESFGTKIRNTAVGVCVGTGRLASAIWMGYTAFFYALLGFSGLFVVMGGCLFLIMIAVLIFGHNTSKRTLEDISGEKTPQAAAAR